MTTELYRQLAETKLDKIQRIPDLALLKIEVTFIPKDVNGFGPAVTAYALRSATNIIKTKLRKLDSCTRAGNELTLFLPKTTTEDARKASRRVIAIIRDYMEKIGVESVTFNIGVAASHNSDNPDEIFIQADRELKQNRSRNNHHHYSTYL